MSAKHVHSEDPLELPAPRSRLSAYAEPTPAASGFETGLLTLLGLAVAGVGVAFAVGPVVSWRAAHFIADLDGALLQGCGLAVGGLALIGLGMVRRAQNKRQPNESALVLDQVATDLVLLHGHVEDVSKRCERIAHAIESSNSEIGKLREQRTNEAGRSGGNEDALFGLATSLDKLGMRIEQRLKAQQVALHESLDAMAAAMQRTHHSLAEQMTASLVVHAAPPVSEPPAPLPAGDPSDASNGSLGLLDSLDDDGSTRRHERVQTEPGFDLARLEQVQRELAEGSAHGRSWEEELQMVEASEARNKLDQLEHLLADPELRALLDSLRQRS